MKFLSPTLSAPLYGSQRNLLGEIEQLPLDMSRRQVVMSIPVRFPGYSTVLAARSWTYLFPQGFCYDAAANQMFMMYGSNTSTPWVSVHNATTGAYISGFSLDRDFGESIQAVKVSGVRYLYMTSGTDMCRWNINTLPANQATITPANTYAINAFSHFAYKDGQFIVQTRVQTSGGLHKFWFTRWNETFTTKLGEVRFEQGDNWTIDASLIPLNPKAQGMCAFRDGFATIYGGGHVPGTTTFTPDKLHGTKIMDQYGNTIATGLCDPNKFAQVLIDPGNPVTYLESEGIAEYNGELRAPWCTSSNATLPDADTRGILITREAGGPLEFKAAEAAPVRVGNITRIQGAIHCPTAGSLWNPLEGSGITTLEGVLEMMRSASMQKFSFITTGVTMTDINGDAIPSGMFVEIRTGNFFSWDVSFTTNLRTYGLWVSGAAGALAQSERRPHAGFARGTGAPQAMGSTADVAGCTLTVPVGLGAIFEVQAVCDIAGTSGVPIVRLSVNGVSQAGDMNCRTNGMNAQQWLIEGQTAGNRIFKLTVSGAGSLWGTTSSIMVKEA